MPLNDIKCENGTELNRTYFINLISESILDEHAYTEQYECREIDMSIYDGDVTVEEFEQLIQDVENKTIQDPELISELANLTPMLESLLPK